VTWLGQKKLALVPLYRPNAHPPDQIPIDWPNQILRRVLFDPEPKTGTDRSLRAYIHAASSGVADLDAVVLPMQTIDEQDVRLENLDAQLPQLRSQLNAERFDAAAIVMLGGPGAGTSQRGGFWARFVMLEGVGVWAMEFMHCLTGFADLYTLNGYADNPHGDMGAFDQMACSCATHPSAYTKAALRWLDASAIAHHASGATEYSLYSVGLVQPPPSGRLAAVQIGSQVPYLMVEARQRVDQFDANIPSEGVIVYRVQTSDPLGVAQNNIIPIFLLTTLTPGMAYTSDSGVMVRVTGALPGGYSIVIDTPDPNAIPWTSVAEGSSTPGAPVSAVVTGPDRVTLFLADRNGGVYTASGNANIGWGQWTSVAEGSSTPGAPVTAVVTGPDRVTLFLADPNGGIYTASGNANTGWGQWTSVAEGSSTPGAPVTAVVTGPDRVTLFLADRNGGVYTASGNANIGWGQWTSVAEGSSTPGAPVTAVVTGPDRVTLFLADPNGGVYTTTKKTRPS
jgi:ribosomal protein S6E (S10)